jgi:hypothetical protein
VEHTISSLISAAERGDRSASEALFAALYSELHSPSANLGDTVFP